MFSSHGTIGHYRWSISCFRTTRRGYISRCGRFSRNRRCEICIRRLPWFVIELIIQFNMENKWIHNSSISGTKRFLIFRESLAFGIALLCTLSFIDGRFFSFAKYICSASFLICAGAIAYDLILSHKAREKALISSIVLLIIMVVLSIMALIFDILFLV